MSKHVLAGLAAGVLVLSFAEAAETINAAGATFPAPLYQKWFGEYRSIHPNVQINYQAIGSGGGIQQLTAGTVDFGASDKPMSDEQEAKITKFHVLHFPTVLGGVVPTYNLRGISSPLKFTGQTLAGIFLGTIRKWSDAALKKDNPGVNLPDAEIKVVHRADGSGTTFVWTDFLSKISPEWKSKVGADTSVQWPKGLGSKGNEGVAGQVKQTPNSIGYVELLYAVQNKMAFGMVKNVAGNFVLANFNTVTDAAAGAAKNMPDDFRVSITNAPGKNAYPISTFTWLLIPEKIEDSAKRKAIIGFLQWMMTSGQKEATSLSYAPLPQAVVMKEEKQLAKIR